MKKIFIVLFFAGTIHSAFAQKGKVQSALNQKDARITSYNVCYTKLLRVTVEWICREEESSSRDNQ